MKTKLLAILLVIICVAGILPLSAMASENETIQLTDYVYTGLSYSSASLGSSAVHPMWFSYNGGAEGFCADHGKGMGTSLIGQTYGNRTQVTDPTVLLFMAYYYSHTTDSFTDNATAMGLNTLWDGEYAYLMNAWVQAIVWRYRTGTMSNPVIAAAEELRDIYRGLKGAWSTSIDDPMPGSSASYREFTQSIFDQGTSTWGTAEAYIYAFTGAGSVEHPAYTVQSIVVGSVDNRTTEIPETYALTVRKVDSSNANNTLSGAKFYVERVGTNQHWNVVTGSDGTYTLSGLDAGPYAVTETEAPAGYAIDNAGPQYITLPSNGSSTITVTFKDSPDIPPSGSIRKVDRDHPNRGLAGATIAIEGVDNSFYGEFQTGSDGTLEGVVWESMTYGSYKAYEIAPPEGYILDPQIKTFRIDENHTDVQLVFTNDAKVRVLLQKQNETGAALPGAVFNILRDGQIIATEATDAGGRITVTDVTEGLYTFVEVSAPAGYAKCDPVMVHVDHDTVVGGGTVTVTAKDYRLPNLTIEKRDKTTGAAVPGTVFAVKGIHSGYSTEVTTGADGKAVLTGLDVDSYEVREISVPHPYILDESNVQTVWLEPGSSHTLTFENLKKPSLKLVKYDEETGNPLANTTFAVYRNAELLGEYTTDASGEVILTDLEPGTYLVQEIATAATHVVNSTPQQIELTADGGEHRLVFNNSLKPDIRIKKVDSETQAPLAGARFRVSSVGSGFSNEYVSDASGEIVLTDMEPGSYTVEEISAPDGYLIDDAVRTIEINAGESAEFVFSDTKKPILQLRKLDAETQAPLAGASFRIAKIGDESHYLDRVTDASGLITIEGMEPGAYSVREISAPSGYILDSTEYHVQLTPGETSTLVVNNHRRPDLRIVKFDEQTMSPLSDTTFEIYKDTVLLGTYTTNDSGEILLYDLEPGTYLVKEVGVAPGYVVNSTPQEIELEAGAEDYTLVFMNLLKPGIHLLKVDAQTKQPLPNARFRVTLIGGSFSKEYVSDENGEVNLTELEPGSYLCEELTAPEHYLIDDAQRTIRINAGEDAQFVFANSRKPSLTVIKYDPNLDKYLPGATFRMTRIEDGSRYLDRITDVDGSFTVNDLEPGVYSVMELDAPTGYVLNVTEYHVELFPGQDSQLIVNNEKKPDLKIIKRDAVTGEPIPGATFTIRKIDSSTLTTETTDINGEIYLKEMDPGVYEIAEQSVPDDYLLDPVPQQITLEPNKLGVVQFQDYKKPSLTIQKIDSATGKPVEGARFHIIYASNHTFSGEINDLGEHYTDADGIIHLDKLQDGWYRIEETQAPEGYRIQGTGVVECYIAAGTDKVITVENVPLSTILIRKMDSETGKPLAGAWFRLKYLNDRTSMDGTTLGEYVTDVDGQIEIPDLDEGTYIVEEISAPAGYVLSEANTRTVYLAGETQDFVSLIYGNQKMGSLLIIKKDSITGEPLAGVEFVVTDSDGAVVGNSNGLYTTDFAGSILIPNLEPGKTVVVKETRTISGYILDDAPQTIKIKANETMTLEFRNQPKGTLIIQKTDSATGEPLTGAEFKITAASGELTADNEGLISSNGIYRVDSNGQIVLERLNPGVYVVTETKAPNGYVLIAQPQTVVVNPGDTQTLVFGNPPKGSLTINKLDSVSGLPLEGCVFTITYADGRVVDDGTLSSNGLYVTDHNGQIVIANITGTMTVTEEKTVSGYVIDPETRSQTVVVNPDDAQVLTFRNAPKGTLIVEKYDKVTGNPLEGAEFKIVTSSGELLAENEGLTSTNGLYVTDENGQIVLSRLSPATYIVTETKAPEGYVLDSLPQTVVVNTADTQTVRFFNEPLATLTIIKRDVDTGEMLAGAAFTVKDAAGMPIGAEKSYVTGDDGTVTLTGLTPNTAVVVSEEEPPVGYWNGSDLQTAMLRSGVVNSITFENRRLGTLIIRKFIEGTSNQPLKGVAFRVTSSDGTDLGPDGGVYYTDAKGEIILNDLQPDITVKVREIKTVDGYILDGTPQDIRIIGGQTQQLTFWNAPRQSLTIQKYASGSADPIEGALFLVTDSSGMVLGTNNGTFTTDRNGRILITGLEPGTTVTAREIKTAPGYVLDTTPQSIMIKAGEAQTMTFYNERKGGLVIRKVDSVTGEALAGAEFLITRIDGSYVDDHEGQTSTQGIYSTDRNGEIRLLALAPDTYVIRETKAPEGYVLSGAEQSVRVNANDTQYLTFENTPLQSLVIQKYIDGTTSPLAGVMFLVTDNAGNYIGSADGRHITDADGRIVLNGLAPGTTLVIREVKTVKGYALNSEPQTIIVSGAYGQVHAVAASGAAGTATGGTGDNTLTFYDEQLNTLVIHKYEDGTRQPLKGVEFKVTDASGAPVGNSNGIYYTNRFGDIFIPELESSTVVTVRETKALDGYILDTLPQTIEIRGSGELNELTFYNSRQGTLIVRKLDSVTKKPLAGVVFKIAYSDGRFVEADGGKMNSNGLYSTNRYGEIRIYGVTGTVVVTEEATIPGYKINEGEKTQTAEVNADSSTSLVFYNEPLGGLLVTKTDKDTGERIKGVEIEVRKMNGEVVGTYTTDRSGEIYLPSLEAGWYNVTEIKAAEGYKLDPTPAQVCVKDGQTTQLSLVNERFSRIVIHKTDSITGKGIYGVAFMVYDSGRNPVEQLITDQNGYAQTKTELSAGQYYVREMEAAEGYLADTKYKTVLVSAEKNSLIEWENTPITAQIQISKYAAEYNELTGQAKGAALQGAVYEIIRERSGAVVGYITTDARGVAASAPLPLGRYIIREVTPPAYWQLSEQTFDVTLEYAGQIVKLADYDRPAKLSVGITKSGLKEVLAGDMMTYRFTVANTSNVGLSSFFWHDKIPYDVTGAFSLTTGTYSHRLAYRVLYKTNCNEYRVLASNLLTTNNYALPLSSLPLQSGEVVTDIYFDFGNVPAGFQSKTQPTLTVFVNPNTINGYNVINRADLGGQYSEAWQTAVASWVTIVRNLTKSDPLPKTGY